MIPSAWRARLYRWRWWLAALALLLVVRAALPEMLRRVIISQASEALRARVDVGDVDLRLWRGGVALEQVAVRAADAPAPPPEPEAEDPAAPPPPAFGAHSPIVGFRRLAVEIRYLPLFSKTIQFREIVLDRPRVALDRLASGDLNVMALVPAEPDAAAAPTPTPTAAPDAAGEEAGWSVGVDAFLLSDGRLRFRDLALAGSEPVELGIDRIAVQEVGLTPAVYGKPGAILLKLGVDEGVIDVFARVTLDGPAVRVSTEVKADRLPLRRARLYVPNVGWSDLRGELDLALTYELEPHARNALGGSLALRDVSVAVPALEDVAVGWTSLAVDLEEIDLLAQRAAVRSVTLDGPHIAVQLHGGALLPALARGTAPVGPPATATGAPAPDDAAEETGAADAPTATPTATAAGDAEQPTATAPREDETPTAAPATATAAEAGTPLATAAPSDAGPTGTPAEEGATTTPASAGPASGTAASDSPAPGTPIAGTPTPAPEADAAPSPSDVPPPPWSWQVANVAVRDGTVRIRSEQPPLDIGVALTATNLSGAADAIGHVALQLAVAPGTLALDGDVRLAPVPAFGGTLKITDLPLPPLVAVSGALPPDALPSAALRSDLAIAAGLPTAGEAAAADRLRVTGTLGLAGLRAAPPQAEGLAVELRDLELRLDETAVPGVIPPGQAAPAGAVIDLAAALTLGDLHVTRAGEAPLDVAAQQIVLTIPGVRVPAALARLAPADGVPVVGGALGIELAAPRVALGAGDLTFAAQRVALAVNDLALPVVLPAAAESAPPPAADAGAPPEEPPAAAPPGDSAHIVAPAAPPLRLALQLDLEQPAVATAQGRELNVGAQAVALRLTDVLVPGFVAGAAPAPSAEPLRAGATLTLTAPRVARGDGKEFAVSARAVSVPLRSLALPGVPGGLPAGHAAEPIRAELGEVRLEQPAIRVTRTSEGIVLPGAAAEGTAAGTPASVPTPAPAAATPAPVPAAAAAPPDAAPALELQVAALRVQRGGLEFTDRAVQPAFHTRFAPIEIDARAIRLPGPQVKPLTVDIRGAEQGRITVRGSLSPTASDLTLVVDELPLAQFNPYAAAYSPYGIADGALSIESSATARGERYEVKNDITLHQFDLTGAEGDSLFEQNFGIPLSLALALLRDVQGDIDLGVPLQVDRSGKTEVDVMAVVRSALRQAIAGAVTSPLKMLGAVAGGTGAPVAPAPIAFRLGRAEPTKAGAESAERLAAFLAGRPAMGVELSTAPRAEDARWLHEQGLFAAWAEEGFFERSLAFLTARGPRQRIRAYLDARAGDGKPELSAEDAALLDEWLAERPAPDAATLQALAEARLAAVEGVLRAKGIDAARIGRAAPAGAPASSASGQPVVGIRLRPAGQVAAAETAEEPETPP